MSEGNGNCFTVAMGFVATPLPRQLCAASGIPYRKDAKGPFRIVHGTPVGTSGAIVGRRHWHGWVEVATGPGWDTVGADAATWAVLDYSNGKQVRITRDLYYSVGQLDEATVWRFTLAEAEQLYRRHRHCGPWVPGWEAMADGTEGMVSR